MEELDLREMLSILWKNKILIALLTILGCIIGGIYNLKIMTPKYQSTTSIILSIKEKNPTEDNLDVVTTNDINLSEKLIETYTRIIKSDTVIEKVKNNLNLDITQEEILENIKVERKTGTTVLELTVQNEDPQIAKSIAEEIPQVFFDELKDLYNITSVKILDYPKLATEPYNINLIKYGLLGAIFGMFLAVMICFIKVMLNENIKTEQDVEKNLKVPVLVSIGKGTVKDRLVALNRNSACSELFRLLVSNIKNSKKKTLLIASSYPGEGKSWVASNLAVTYAKSGKRVLLIDADMRRGRQHTIFNLDDSKGLSNIVNDEENVSLEECINKSIIDNLDIITRGFANIDYSKLLFSDTIEKILQVTKEKYEYIILDGTPNSLVADDMMLSNLVDSTVLVVKYDNTSVRELKRIKTRIENAGGNVLGVVINQIPGISKKYENSYYNYNYTNSMQLVNNKLKKINDVRNKINKTI